QTASRSPFLVRGSVENIDRREYRCALSVHRFGAAVQEASRCASYVLHLSRFDTSPVIPLKLPVIALKLPFIPLYPNISLWLAISPQLCSFSPRPPRDSPSPTAARLQAQFSTRPVALSLALASRPLTLQPILSTPPQQAQRVAI